MTAPLISSPKFDSKPLNLAMMFEMTPPPPDHVFPGYLAATVGGLVSAGGIGKSTWTLEASTALASQAAGGDLLGLGIQKYGKVLYLAAEDPAEAIWARIHTLAGHLDRTVLPRVVENLEIHSLLGRGGEVDLMSEAFQEWLLERAKGKRLVVLDTLTRFHCLDENKAADAKAIMAVLERSAALTRAAHLFLHHISKAAAFAGLNELQQAARGSSVFVDNSRWLSFVAVMTPAEAEKYGIDEASRWRYVNWNISKQNYSAPLEDEWYERTAGGILRPAKFRTGHDLGKKRPQRKERGDA